MRALDDVPEVAVARAIVQVLAAVVAMADRAPVGGLRGQDHLHRQVDLAVEVIMAAQAADWGPIRLRHNGREHLHDRASYRYFWHVIERAHRTSAGGHSQLPAEARFRWFGH